MFFNGCGDSYLRETSETYIKLNEWNKFTVTWDGNTNTFTSYVNGNVIASMNGLVWPNSKLLIGGWQESPHSSAGVNWGNANGTYRNLVFKEGIDLQ